MAGEEIPIVFRSSWIARTKISIEPRKGKSDTKPVIGVISPSRLKLFTGTEEGDGPFFKGTPADEAGFRYAT